MPLRRTADRRVDRNGRTSLENRGLVMMNGLRIRVAAGLLLGVLAVLGTAQVHAAAPVPIRYACGEGQNLVIQRDRTSAHVNFIDRSYELRRKPSSIGVKYISPTAALIIDGQSAVFVAEDRLQLGACTEALPIASAK